MRVAIIGELYSQNLGDGVICRCTESLLKRHSELGDKVTCIDMSCREDYETMKTIRLNCFQTFWRRITNKCFSSPGVVFIAKSIMGEKLYQYWTWERYNDLIIQKICKDNPADLLVFAGGELFKDYFVFNMKYFVNQYSKQHSAIWFNACGVDENNSLLVTKYFRRILRNPRIKRLTTRNDYQTCSKLIEKGRYRFVPDPAICTADFFEGNHSADKIEVGLGIMAIVDLEKKKSKLLEYWKSVIDELQRKKIPYKLFCNGAKEDYEFAQEVANYSGLSKEKVFSAPKTPEELVWQVTSFNRICSFRMHSVIIAYAFQIPFVGFSWDKKLIDFSKFVDAEQQIVDWEMMDASTTVQRMLECKLNSRRLYELKQMIYKEFENWKTIN